MSKQYGLLFMIVFIYKIQRFLYREILQICEVFFLIFTFNKKRKKTNKNVFLNSKKTFHKQQNCFVYICFIKTFFCLFLFWKSTLDHNHMNILITLNHLLSPITANNSRKLQNIITWVHDNNTHIALRTRFGILIALLHQIAHLRKKVRINRRAIKNQMSNALDHSSVEKVGPFGVEHEMGVAVEKSVASLGDPAVFSVLANLSKAQLLLFHEVS